MQRLRLMMTVSISSKIQLEDIPVFQRKLAATTIDAVLAYVHLLESDEAIAA